MQEKSELKLIFRRIEELRLKKGVTWDQIADELGVSKVMLHYIKTGQRKPSNKVLYRLEEAEIRAGLRQRPSFDLPHRDSTVSDTPIVDGYMQELKKRWKRRPTDHDEIALAVHILFPGHAEKILDCLKQK